MRRLNCISLFTTAVVICASSAAAQPEAGTVFVTGTALAAIERYPTTEGTGTTDTDAGGTVAGGALGLGVFLTPRVSARAEWTLTDTHTTTLEFDIGSLAASSSGGFLGTPAPGFVVLERTATQRRRSSAGFALLGYHLPAGRASIEVLGGLGIVHRRITVVYDLRIPSGIGLTVPPTEFTTAGYDAVAVVGADVAVSIINHVALVPQVRAYAVGGALSVRPGLGLRWTF